MQNFEIESCKRYFAGLSKTHISIFPIFVLNLPDYKITLNSAFYNGKRWIGKEIYTGEDENLPFQNWENVLKFTKLELNRISLILTPLFENDKLTAWNNFQKINGKMSYDEITMENYKDETDNYFDNLIKKLTDYKFREEKVSNGKIQKMYITEDPENCRNTEIKTWLPIWIAWNTFYTKIKQDLKDGKIKQL